MSHVYLCPELLGLPGGSVDTGMYLHLPVGTQQVIMLARLSVPRSGQAVQK